jgi:hypothetical protein
MRKENYSDFTPTARLAYLAALVHETRRYGQCYVHAGARGFADSVTGIVDGREVSFDSVSWGRSLYTPRGHKYKVHARYSDTREPVPSKKLGSIHTAE